MDIAYKRAVNPERTSKRLHMGNPQTVVIKKFLCYSCICERRL